MGKRYDELSDRLIDFIKEQKIFFIGTAAAGGRVNVSPKGLDSLRVLTKNSVIWLNLTGSGNESAAHVQENPRMTIMFMSVAGTPMILRIYGTASCIHKGEERWHKLYPLFPDTPGARQIFEMKVELVQTSCGMAVPFYEYVGDRDQLTVWSGRKGESGINEYWREKNRISLDGKEVKISE